MPWGSEEESNIKSAGKNWSWMTLTTSPILTSSHVTVWKVPSRNTRTRRSFTSRSERCRFCGGEKYRRHWHIYVLYNIWLHKYYTQRFARFNISTFIEQSMQNEIARIKQADISILYATSTILHTKSSRISLIAVASNTTLNGIIVVKWPVGDTPGNCYKNCVDRKKGEWI